MRFSILYIVCRSNDCHIKALWFKTQNRIWRLYFIARFQNWCSSGVVSAISAFLFTNQRYYFKNQGVLQFFFVKNLWRPKIAPYYAKKRCVLDRTRRLFYTYSALQKHSWRALRQNGGYFDRQKADLIFAGAAGSRISERGALPLRGTVAGAVGDHGIRGAVRFSDDLQLLRPPAHSTGTAVCHSFLS